MRFFPYFLTFESHFRGSCFLRLKNHKDKSVLILNLSQNPVKMKIHNFFNKFPRPIQIFSAKEHQNLPYHRNQPLIDHFGPSGSGLGCKEGF